MKKQFFFALFALAITTTNVNAQQMVAALTAEQKTEKKEPNALTKLALLKLSTAGISNEQLAKAYPVFFEYYSTKKKVDEQIAVGENKNAADVEYAKLIQNRDEKLSEFLSKNEMKSFKTKLEKELADGETK